MKNMIFYILLGYYIAKRSVFAAYQRVILLIFSRFTATVDNTTIATFDQVSLKHNYSALSRFPLPKIVLLRMWNDLMTQFVNEIGLSDTRMRYYREMKHYCRYAAKALGGEKHFEINAEHHFLKAKKIMEGYGESGSSLTQSVAQIAKAQGYHLRPDQLSIREYFDLIRLHKQA